MGDQMSGMTRIKTYTVSFGLFLVLELLHDVVYLLCECIQHMCTYIFSTMVVIVRVIVMRMIGRSRSAARVIMPM